MTTTTTTSVTYSVNAQRFAIDFCAPVETDSIKTLSRLLGLAFDYYQFAEVRLTLDSPGGNGPALSQALQMIQSRRERGHAVHMGAGPRCASAAAILLACGTWGQRKAHPTSMVLFHTGRLMMQEMALTRERAVNFAQQLSQVDQRLVTFLVGAMIQGAGGEVSLRSLMQSRCEALFHQWDAVHDAIARQDIFASQERAPWLKPLRSELNRSTTMPARGSVRNFKAWLVAHLVKRFEEDSPMDLREAYALALIDGVEGVLPIESCGLNQTQTMPESETDADETPMPSMRLTHFSISGQVSRGRIQARSATAC